MGISFIYGIFHAAGPGHGKAVISSYLLANEETWRRGIALSFASALLQALTAVAIVAVAAVLIGATAKMMGDTVQVIEMVSYTLIVLLGARLIWVKGRGFLRTLHAARSGPEPAAAEAAADRAPHVHAADADCHHPDHSHHDHANARSRPRPSSRRRRRGGRVALGACAWAGAGGIGRAGRLAPRFVGDRRRRIAALLGCDHRPRLCPGAGLVLGRRRLDLRDGRRHGDHRRGDRHARRRRQGRGEAVCRRRATATARLFCAASRSAPRSR